METPIISYEDNQIELLKQETGRLLRRLGVNSSYKGFWYTVFAVALALVNPMELTFVCKGLYLDIAVRFHTNPNCVERNIRTIKQIIWSYGDRQLLDDIFGSAPASKPLHNAAFIDLLSQYVKKQLELH